MKNKANLLETAKCIKILEATLENVTKLEDEALRVFHPFCSLKEIEKRFKYWEELDNVQCHSLAYSSIRLQPYNEIKNAFRDVQDATISRKEFEAILQPSCEAIDKFIEDIEKVLNKKNMILSNLYDKFANASDDFKFIFTEPRVKEIILNELLKS